MRTEPSIPSFSFRCSRGPCCGSLRTAANQDSQDVIRSTTGPRSSLDSKHSILIISQFPALHSTLHSTLRQSAASAPRRACCVRRAGLLHYYAVRSPALRQNAVSVTMGQTMLRASNTLHEAAEQCLHKSRDDAGARASGVRLPKLSTSWPASRLALHSPIRHRQSAPEPTLASMYCEESKPCPLCEAAHRNFVSDGGDRMRFQLGITLREAKVTGRTASLRAECIGLCRRMVRGGVSGCWPRNDARRCSSTHSFRA